MGDKRIISVAITGNWGDKSTNPAIPMTPEEMARTPMHVGKRALQLCIFICVMKRGIRP